MHELPLVFFTVLAQASVGLFILLTVLLITPNNMLLKKTSSTMILVSLAFIIVAGFSAMFHLGQPLKAANALFRVGSSAMSNEIAACAVYSALIFIALLLSYKLPLNSVFIKLYFFLASIIGAYFLILIAKVYNINTISQWFTPYTTIQMVVSAFTIGGALVLFWRSSWIGICAVVFSCLVGLAILPDYFVFLAGTAEQALEDNVLLFAIKVVLYLVGLSLAFMSYFREEKLLALAVILIFIAAELIGRIAFYNLWNIGM